MAVISVLQDDNILPARMGAREAKRKFIGFAAGIHEETNTQ